MEVMGNNDWDRGTERLSDAAYDFFIPLRVAFDHHCAMERQQDAIELWCCLQARNQTRSQGLECFVGERPIGCRRYHETGEDIEPFLVRAIEVAGYLGIGLTP